MTQNQSGTFFYTPDIKVYIKSSVLGKIVDISHDVIDFVINRNLNSTSTASVTLANSNFKYTPGRKSNNWNDSVPLETMDKIIIYLKRVKYVQVFSGYITVAPIITLIPQPVQIQAHCTLYTIQNTFWDPNIPENQVMIPGMMMTVGVGNLSATSYDDGGAGQGIVNVLTKVAGWDRNKIHISALPNQWVDKMIEGAYDDLSQSTADTKQRFMRALDGAGIMSGYNLIANGSTKWKGDFVIKEGQVIEPGDNKYSLMQQYTAIPNGDSLNVSLAPEGLGYSIDYSSEGLTGIVVKYVRKSRVAQTYMKAINKDYSGDDGITTVEHADSEWWCVLPWNYFLNGSDSKVKELARAWLARDPSDGKFSGRKILVTSVNNGQQIVVKASFVGRTDSKMIVSRRAWEHLAGEVVSSSLTGSRNGDFYSNVDVQCTAVWALDNYTNSDGSQVPITIGIQDNSALVDKLNQFGIGTTRTFAQQQSQVKADLRMTAEDWVQLCLDLAGITKNRQNILLLNEWIRVENDRDPNEKWDERCNPLNMTWLTDTNKAKKPTYPNLFVAAIMWALAMRPQNSTFDELPVMKNAPHFYGIRAAFSTEKVDIRKPGGQGEIGYREKYYWSMWCGVAMQTYNGNSKYEWQDVNDEVGAGRDKKYRGTTWGDVTNRFNSDQKFIMQKETLSYAIINSGRDGTGDSKWRTDNEFGSLLLNNSRALFLSKERKTQQATIDRFTTRPGTSITINTIFGSPTPRVTFGDATNANDYNDYTDKQKLPVQGMTSKQGAASSNERNTNRDQLISVWNQIIGDNRIPADITPVAGASDVGAAAPDSSFNIAFQSAQLSELAMAVFGTPRGFITDESLLKTVASMSTSTLRDFQSAPNGDFVCWFPDYFGQYGQAPVLNIHDIEIIDFSIYHDDTSLTTHVAVAGDPYEIGANVGLAQWMQSNGIVSVQIDQLMRQVFNDEYDAVKRQLGPHAENFLNRYGMRPRVESVPMIRNHVTEFMYAWRIFMAGWAATYATQVQFTFMPELYPGMRIRLADHNIELYVQSVSHNGSRSGGFSTTARVTCPVIRTSTSAKPQMLHYGFPYKPTRA